MDAAADPAHNFSITHDRRGNGGHCFSSGAGDIRIIDETGLATSDDLFYIIPVSYGRAGPVGGQCIACRIKVQEVVIDGVLFNFFVQVGKNRLFISGEDYGRAGDDSDFGLPLGEPTADNRCVVADFFVHCGFHFTHQDFAGFQVVDATENS